VFYRDIALLEVFVSVDFAVAFFFAIIEVDADEVLEADKL